jgi:hypothetical protein
MGKTRSILLLRYTLRNEQSDMPITDFSMVAGLFEQQCTNLSKLRKNPCEELGECLRLKRKKAKS